MKLEAVHNVGGYTVRHLLRKGVGGLFILSAAMKIVAVDYMMDLLFTLMPTSWIGWVSEGFLLTGLLILVAVEMLIGILLWIGNRLSKILSVTILFLTFMSLLNGYQCGPGSQIAVALEAGFPCRRK